MDLGILRLYAKNCLAFDWLAAGLQLMSLSHLADSSPMPLCVTATGARRFQEINSAFAHGQDAVLLLASGVTLSKSSLMALAEARIAQPQALLGCCLADGKFQMKTLLPGWRWSESQCEWRPEWCIRIKADPTAPKILPCDWLSAEALLIPRIAWDAVGSFDPDLDPPLAVVDWCLRAREAGFPCFEVQTAIAFMQFSPAQCPGPLGPTRLPELQGMLTLARKHRLPMGHTRLAWQFMHKAINKELGRVHYWTDYGFHPSPLQRTVWYLRNLFLAFRRARIPSLILGVFWKFIATSLRRRSR